MRQVAIENLTSPLRAPLQAGYCRSFGCRLLGLAFRREISEQSGLLVFHAGEGRLESAIHMLGMRFDLGIVWFNSSGQVVDLRPARRWRSFMVPRAAACYVLEVHPARLNEFQIGDEISFEEIP